MQSAIDTASTLWQLLKNLASIVGTVFSAFDMEGGGALNTLTALTGAVAEFLKSAEGQDALHALGRILASIGGAYGKVFMSFLEVAADLLVRLEPFIVAFADAVGVYLAGALQAIQPVLQLFADVLGFLGPSLGPVVAGLYAANKAIAAARVVWAALNVVMDMNPFLLIAAAVVALALLIYQNWDAIKEFLAGVWQWIADTAKAIWQWIYESIVQPVINAFTAVVEWFTKMGAFIGGMMSAALQAVKDAWNWIQQKFIDAGRAIGDAVGSAVENVLSFFRSLPGNILNFLTSLPGKMLQVGKDIIMGIVHGLENAAHWIWDKITEIASDAWNAVTDFFSISSPSKLTQWGGQMIGQGLANGIASMTGKVVQAASTMAQAVSEELTGASATMAANLALTGDVSGIPKTIGATVPLTATAGPGSTAAVAGGGGGKTVIVQIESVSLNVAGNLDPTNPTAYRKTLVNLKDSLRNLDKEYA